MFPVLKRQIMKLHYKHLKLVALLLFVTFLVSSCKVYHSGTVSVDEAVSSFKEVKVKSYDNETYRFKRLGKRNGKLYGVAHRNYAEHYLSSYIVDNTIYICSVLRKHHTTNVAR